MQFIKLGKRHKAKREFVAESRKTTIVPRPSFHEMGLDAYLARWLQRQYEYRAGSGSSVYLSELVNGVLYGVSVSPEQIERHMDAVFPGCKGIHQGRVVWNDVGLVASVHRHPYPKGAEL